MGQAPKENQSGQMEQDIYQEPEQIIYKPEPEGELVSHMSVSTPAGKLNIDTGNVVVDGAILITIVILISAVIYGKFFHVKSA